MITLAVAIAVLSWISVVPSGTPLDALQQGGSGQALVDAGTGLPVGEGVTDGAGTETTVTGPGAGTAAGAGPAAGPAAAGPQAAGPGNVASKDFGPIDCAKKQNGGATDKGVSAKSIKIAANIVTSGVGASFLSEAPLAMEAVKRRVNSKGGICGRQLELFTVNDGWDAARGQQNIKDFINQGYFALPVVPSSEGLSAAISGGDIARAGIPVVGADGMRKEQYDAQGNAKWVWPVATATVSQVRIMAKYAYEKKGARTMGIVYDNKYKFGVEGATAFEKYVKTLKGASLKAKYGIEPGLNKYPQANSFNGDCDRCDLVVFLLEPSTAKQWLTDAGQGGLGKKATMGAQPLFNKKVFADQCGAICNGMFVWSGYVPALPENASIPGVSRYMQELRSVSPSADASNQFTQGAYLGMEIFVEAVTRCSPTGLTRACVQKTMDSLDFQTDLAAKLSWRAGNHFANVGARGYSLSYQGPTFRGFRDEQTGFVRDPTPGVI